MAIRLLLLLIATEALVQLWFHAAPLQPLRAFLIRHAPFLRAGGDHLLNCKYCTSVWIGGFMAALWFAMDYSMFIFWFVLALSLHRGANILHILISLLQDIQMDVRIQRGKNAGR